MKKISTFVSFHKFLFHLSLLIGQSSILSMKKISTFVSFHKFLFSHLATFFGLLDGNTKFINFGLEKILSSFGNSTLFLNIISLSFSIINAHLNVLDLSSYILIGT